ncbi:MAG: zinc-ribbon domain-containing protein [Gemmatimonadota bacterium]|nr:MAG: zinc-ribbon domain-containing protein [Gemmatimonadota bacterium]
MADKTISCQDCGREFMFTEEEQNYYTQRGFQDPKRCKSCRNARKRQNTSGERRSSGRSPRGQGGYNRW